MTIPPCTCKFVAVGVPPDASGCECHNGDIYKAPFGCDCCACDDYKPSRAFEPAQGHWPVCTCGHVAQDHNQMKREKP